jgi:dTDP-4-amino-4,6-dideoxygalactose transaminase
MSAINIALSMTPFDAEGLRKVMATYEQLPQMQAVADFEKEIATYVGAKYALALNCGTAAIHLALKALGVGTGDEVMVSTFTYVATVNPIIYLGATPVFIDSEPATWNMDPALLEEAIAESLRAGRRPKAILVVHAYGMPASMREIIQIGLRYGLPVVEDAAEALGSELDGLKLGTFCQAGIFSFNNNKIVTTYGGGAMVTNDKELYLSALRSASQSREDKPYYEHRQVGYSYRMGPLNAIQGLLGLRKARDKVKRRRAIYHIYKACLSGISEMEWLNELKPNFSNRWLTTVLLKHLDVAELQKIYQLQGIETRRLWNPMHEQPVFQGFMSMNRGLAKELFVTGLTLPSSDFLADADLEKVCSILLQKSVTRRR